MILMGKQGPRLSFGRLAKRLIIFFFFILAILFITFLLSGYYTSRNQKSYLPEIRLKYLKSSASFSEDIVLRNKWYTLVVDTNGYLNVKTNEGETILSSLTYYASYEGIGENIGLKNVRVNLNNDSTVIIEGDGIGNVMVRIMLAVGKESSSMGISVKTLYNSDIKVLREALLAKFEVPVSAVYLKNRDVDMSRFQKEYWLDKQGMRFGTGPRSSLIYHTPDISSLQLNTKAQLVSVNLDYYLDHPFIHIPYQEDGGGKWIDQSKSEFNAGQLSSHNFNIHFGDLPAITPRFMLVPEGFLAGYVFTEHADGGNIRTHRAAYYGSENITDPQNAVGGFVGYKIPVTKSVFYEDFDDGLSPNSSSNSNAEGQILEFLDQIYSTGNYDLCLHTPDSNNSNREVLAEAIAFMHNKYNARTWIDHGMYPGNNNRETFVADGLDATSEFYAADLWEQYSTNYFWSPAVEAIRFSVQGASLKETLLRLRVKVFFVEFWNRYRYVKKYKGEGFIDAFNDIFHSYTPKLELNSQRPFMRSSFPTPLYWQNISSSDDFYSWPTEFDYDGISRSWDETNLDIEKQHLDILIAEQGFFFNHGYYVRNGIYDDLLVENGVELVVNPYFDKMLAYMDQLRDKGNLYITTVKQIMNYWLLIENITMEFNPDGSIQIINHNEQPVQGLSLALHTDLNSVNIIGANYSSRRVDGDAIVWFDMPAMGRVTIQVVNESL